jgi:hypothetical protein
MWSNGHNDAVFAMVAVPSSIPLASLDHANGYTPMDRLQFPSTTTDAEGFDHLIV